MKLTSAYCSHCGNAFHTANSAHVYSVRVDSRGYLLEIMDGELIADTLHYCSANCMFNREKGVIPEKNIFDLLDIECDVF